MAYSDDRQITLEDMNVILTSPSGLIYTDTPMYIRQVEKPSFSTRPPLPSSPYMHFSVTLEFSIPNLNHFEHNPDGAFAWQVPCWAITPYGRTTQGPLTEEDLGPCFRALLHHQMMNVPLQILSFNPHTYMNPITSEAFNGLLLGTSPSASTPLMEYNFYVNLMETAIFHAPVNNAVFPYRSFQDNADVPVYLLDL